MPVAILFPRFDHTAIEERYASWQSEMLLRRQASSIHYYDDDDTAAHAVRHVESPHILVVTDPLILPGPGVVEHLIGVLEKNKVFAALPVTNESRHGAQRASNAPYMTLRELEIEAVALRERETGMDRLTWDSSNPGAFLAVTATLAEL